MADEEQEYQDALRREQLEALEREKSYYTARKQTDRAKAVDASLKAARGDSAPRERAVDRRASEKR
ncbi:MAG: hypothetical protein ACRDYU_03680 [Actinomycetes bacterium]